jgi:hypothetical protein
MGGIRGASFGYMDDVNVLGEEGEDIVIVNKVYMLLRRPPGPSSSLTARQRFWGWAPGRAARSGLSHGSRL